MNGELLLAPLEDAGFLARLVPVSVLGGMKAWFGRLDRDSVIFTKYPSILHFSPPESMPGASSLLLLAARSPAVRVGFTFDAGVKTFVIPPTYVNLDLRARADDVIQSALENTQHRVERAGVPVKLLSAMGGLSRYGRNNITYYPGLGSYVHLQAFFTTLPPVHGVVQPQMAEECASCRACIKACPAGAISESSFVIDVKKCLTFYNEYIEPFPAWVDAKAHHCLMGCMRCQDICPMNKGNKDFVVDGPVFDAVETAAILASAPLGSLSPAAVSRLEEIQFKDDYLVFARNLSIMVNA